MAKVFGPCLSIDSKGSIGKAICFQGRPKGSAVMIRPVPSRKSLDEPSPAKQTQRVIIKSLVEQWQALGDAARDVWNRAAKEVNYVGAGYHYFMHKGGVFPSIFSWADSGIQWSDLLVGWAGYN